MMHQLDAKYRQNSPNRIYYKFIAFLLSQSKFCNHEVITNFQTFRTFQDTKKLHRFNNLIYKYINTKWVCK